MGAIMQFESMVEETIISYLQKLDYSFVEDSDWLLNRELDEFINEEVLIDSIMRINNFNDIEIIEEVIRKIKNIENP